MRLLTISGNFYFTFLRENVHQLQCGYFRRNLRRERRASDPGQMSELILSGAYDL